MQEVLSEKTLSIVTAYASELAALAEALMAGGVDDKQAAYALAASISSYDNYKQQHAARMRAQKKKELEELEEDGSSSISFDKRIKAQDYVQRAKNFKLSSSEFRKLLAAAKKYFRLHNRDWPSEKKFASVLEDENFGDSWYEEALR